MNQDINNQKTGNNRFIFSADFYDQLSNDNTDIIDDKTSDQIEQKPLQFDSIIPKIEDEVEKKADVKEQIILENKQTDNKAELVSINDLIIPPISNNDVSSINNSAINEQTLESNMSNNSENNIPTGEFKQETMNKEGPVEEKSTEVENNIMSPLSELDVETGIDTALEQEILNYRTEPIVQPTIVQNSNTMWGEDNDKKVAYRAIRTSIPKTPGFDYTNQPIVSNSSFNVDVKQEENSFATIREDKTSVVPNAAMEAIWQPLSPPPPVVIKDGELEAIKSDKIENAIKNSPVVKSNLLEELSLKEQQTGKISILSRYGEDFCSKDYITNPAIGRHEEIKQLILTLLTPEKSAILVGKPGIGKTSIVEGLAYCLQRNNVPVALRGYRIVSIKAISLIGTLANGETKLQTLVDELKELDKVILFIDETHMLMGATDESSVDFANMFKESLGRGSIKMIGATTNDEYERYILRDKAFVRRFQRIDVEEPTKEQTVRILIGTLPKIEKDTGAKLKYSNYIQSEIMNFIVDITTEYKRVYGIGSRYPDICLTLLSQAFSQAVFDNRSEVNIFDIRNAIENSKNIYQDVIRKELINFDEKFKQIITEEKAM